MDIIEDIEIPEGTLNVGRISISSKCLQAKIIIMDYDVNDAIQSSDKIPTAIKNGIRKLNKNKLEKRVIGFSKTKIIKDLLFKIINWKWLKKNNIVISSLDVEYDENNFLQLLVTFKILSFSNAINTVEKEVVRKVPDEYRDIAQGIIDVVNIEIAEKEKADFVYKMIESAMFKSILEKAQKEILQLLEMLAKDLGKLDVTLESIALDVVEN